MMVKRILHPSLGSSRGYALIPFLVLLVLLSPAASGAQEAGKLISPGPLARAHKDLEGIRECLKCHKLGKGIPNEKCLKCHKKVRARVQAGKGIHGRLERPCYRCHTDHKGRDYPIIFLDKKRFDHGKTGYPLRGRHAAVKERCGKCHKGRGYLQASTECSSCHDSKHKEFEAKEKCERCHGLDSWKRITFEHPGERYTLAGAHGKVACRKCHTDGVYAKRDSRCDGCHKPKHERRFRKKNCTSCHNQDTWKTRSFDHDKTDYVLRGRHEKVRCLDCHKPELVPDPPPERFTCAGCHEDAHKGQFVVKTGGKTAVRPCDGCHDVEGWKPSTFDHDSSTYRLVGGHSKVKCRKCHEGGRYKPVSRECASCHKDVHEGKLRTVRNRPRACDECHDIEGWKPSTYDHGEAGYVLAGAHLEVRCVKCHPGALYSPVDARCLSCHKDKHKGRYGKSCERCHNDESWKLKTAFHDAAFPLQGAHVDLACSDCHTSGSSYAGLVPQCSACHGDPHDNRFGEECLDCHDRSAWRPSYFDHMQTGFLLLGAHGNVPCGECHDPSSPRGSRASFPGTASFSCAVCHEEDYLSTTAPDHLQSGYSKDCSACHLFEQGSWTEGDFNHMGTDFPLGGVHTALSCEQCHIGGQYSGTPTDCYSCHWQRSRDDPWNLQVGTDCGRCHATTAWVPASWSHGDPPASWTLEGLHAGGTCLGCHPGYDASSTGRDCYSCHQADYAGSQDPDHQAVGFPTDCDLCHNAGDPGWNQGTYDHRWYPLDGQHKPYDCNECHAVQNDYNLGNTRCLGCHDQHHKRDPCAECHYVDRWGNTR